MYYTYFVITDVNICIYGYQHASDMNLTQRHQLWCGPLPPDRCSLMYPLVRKKEFRVLHTPKYFCLYLHGYGLV